MTTPQTPAGWYPDPDGSGGHRYWDGYMWTEHRSPAPATPPPPPPPPPAPPAAPEVPAETVAAPQRVGSHRAPDPEEERQPEQSAEVEPPAGATEVIQTFPAAPVTADTPALPDQPSDATAVIPTTPPPAFAPSPADATAVIPTLPPPPPGPPPAAPAAFSPPADGAKGLLVRYLAVCAALFAALIGVVIYAVVSAGSGDVTITSADATTTVATEPTGATEEPTETTATEPTEPTESSETTATEAPPPGGTIDGPMEFSVFGIEVGPTVTSPDAPIEKAAVGEFVVVHMTVTNIGDAPATFLGTFQKLKAAGTVYSIDDEATFYTGGGIAELNPGDSVDVGVAFDVPPGTVPEAIELHADPMSPGIEVPLM